MRLFFTADQHLGEEPAPTNHSGQRPYRTAKEGLEILVRNHNEIVNPDDLVIFNGDIVSSRATDPHAWLKYINRFNGRKWLIIGNHDAFFKHSDLAPYFEKIVNHGEGIEIDLKPPYTDWDLGIRSAQRAVDGDAVDDKDELHLYVTHYPTRARADRFNITAHVHAAWKYQKNMLNCGVDVNFLRPYPADAARYFLTAVEKFYDDDVWVANLRANAIYDDSRGKKGNYFAGLTKGD